MNILKTPIEYAALLRSCYRSDQWGYVAFEAAREFPSTPASYWTAVHNEMLKPQLLDTILTEDER